MVDVRGVFRHLQTTRPGTDNILRISTAAIRCPPATLAQVDGTWLDSVELRQGTAGTGGNPSVISR